MKNDIMLISSDYNQQIKFWSNMDNKCKHIIEYKESAITAIELTQSKESLAFATTNSIKFLDLATMNPNPVLSLDAHNGVINCILFDKDNQNLLFTAGEDCTIKLNDKRTNKFVQEYNHNNYVNSIQFGYKVRIFK